MFGYDNKTVIVVKLLFPNQIYNIYTMGTMQKKEKKRKRGKGRKNKEFFFDRLFFFTCVTCVNRRMLKHT